MKLDFVKCGYGKDFEAIECPPSDWVDEPSDWYIQFMAYDTELWLNEDEVALYGNGNDYLCIIDLMYDPFDGSEWGHIVELAKFPAKDKADAERLLQLAADALYE